MKTILSIIGARPQFVKHAPMQIRLQQRFRALTLHTGQHYDANMSQVFFEELGIPAPDYVLDIAGAKTQAEQTGRMMAGIEKVCMELQPDVLLVYGDTNSTLSGALVAAKLRIPYAHIEAGIRSYNRAMPEEVNRIIADTFAATCFCPTPEAVQNLKLEGIHHAGVHMVGDVMCDMLELIRPRLRRLLEEPYYFCTVHRPYNTDVPGRMQRIVATLNALPHPVIFPVHPRTASCLKQAGIDMAGYPNIRCMEPVGYIESISYQAGSEAVITDSGGIQKEAYMLKKRCITLRSETEWLHTLEHGWNTLVFEDIESIPRALNVSLGSYLPYLLGDGHACEAIAGIMEQQLHGATLHTALRPAPDAVPEPKPA